MATPHKKKHIIAVCGSLNWDMVTLADRLPRSGETLNSKSFSMSPGGKGANAAIALHRLSHIKPVETDDREAPRNAYEDCGLREIEVRMIGSVGSDDFGRRMKDSLVQNFINVDGVRIQDGKTSGVAVILVEAGSGENRILVYPGVNHFLKPEDFSNPASLGTEQPDLVILQLELNPQTVEQVIKTAKNAGIDVLLNPSPAHRLNNSVYEGLTHLILNESEAAILTGRQTEDLKSGFDDWTTITDEILDLGVQHVVVTLGGKGAFFSEQKGKGEHVTAEKVNEDKVVDTSGAGYVLIN